MNLEKKNLGLEVVQPKLLPLECIDKFPDRWLNKRVPHGKENFVTKCLTHRVPKGKKFYRASVIPFFFMNEETYYFMAVDRDYLQITDPGGGISPGEHFIETALRELYEETMGIFDFIEYPNFVMRNSIAYYDNDNIVIFQPVSIENPLDIGICFRNRYWYGRGCGAPPCLLENSYLIWIPDSHLKVLCNKRRNKNVKMSKEMSDLFVGLKNDKKKRSYPEIYIKTKKLLNKAFSFGDLIGP